MITKEELLKISKSFKDGILKEKQLPLLEKDYLQHIILYRFYTKYPNSLVFKGGTCLRILDNLNRFSEDLDFTLLKDKSNEELNKMFESISSDLLLFGIKNKIEKAEGDEKSTISRKFKIQGPLFTEKNPSSINIIKIDISKRKYLIDPDFIERTSLPQRYPDIFPVILIKMFKEEMLAEKFRALIERDKPRDLYDIYFLSASAPFRPDFLTHKLNREFSSKEIVDAINHISKEDWERDLEPFVFGSRLIELDIIKKDILNRIGNNIKLKEK